MGDGLAGSLLLVLAGRNQQVLGWGFCRGETHIHYPLILITTGKIYWML